MAFVRRISGKYKKEPAAKPSRGFILFWHKPILPENTLFVAESGRRRQPMTTQECQGGKKHGADFRQPHIQRVEKVNVIPRPRSGRGNPYS